MRAKASVCSRIKSGFGFVLLMASALVQADSISPTSFSALLGVGESATVRKTVTVSTAPQTTFLDVMFLFDTTGSMGEEIGGAKSRANDILTALGALGSLATGTGTYNDPGTAGLTTNLTTNAVTGAANINAVALIPGSGGDADEQGVQGIVEATGAAWRAGSNRFVIAFGDAAFKGVNANAINALNAVNATFIGIGFLGGGSDFFADADPIAAATGGTTHSATATSTDTIVDAILSGVTSSLSNYSAVTVSDLLAGAPEIGVSVVCVSADIGVCAGDTATGTYDRSIERSFEFDVTFTRLAPGDKSFSTFGLVDGAIVATEADRFGTGVVPEPGTLALLALSMLGLVYVRRRVA